MIRKIRTVPDPVLIRDGRRAGTAVARLALLAAAAQDATSEEASGS